MPQLTNISLAYKAYVYIDDAHTVVATFQFFDTGWCGIKP